MSILQGYSQTIFQKEYSYPLQPNDSWNILKGVIGTPDGGFMIYGNTSQSNSQDPMLVKADDNGNVQWAKSYS